MWGALADAIPRLRKIPVNSFKNNEPLKNVDNKIINPIIIIKELSIIFLGNPQKIQFENVLKSLSRTY